MSSSFGEFIARYGKVILAAWVLVAIIAVSPAMETMERMSNGLGTTDTASTETTEYLSHYFDDPELDLSKMPILVISYDSKEGYRQLNGDTYLAPFVQFLTERLASNGNWSTRLDFSKGGVLSLTKEGTESKGMFLVGFQFEAKYTEDDIYGFIPELRSFIDSAKNDYMYELYENTCFFSLNLTGTEAQAYDTTSHFVSYALFATIIALIFAFFVMGSYFGSVMSAVITTTSMVMSAVITSAIMSYLTNFMDIPLALALIVMMLVILVSFAQNILVVSAYRTRLMKGHDKVDARNETAKRTASIIAVSLLCIVACCLILIFCGNRLFCIVGICAGIGLAVTCLISATVPITIIDLTKNELFWTRSKDGKLRWKPIKKVYDFTKNAIGKFVDRTSSYNKRTIITVGVVLILLSVGCSVYVVQSSEYKNPNYDLMSAFNVGDSKAGLEKLNQYSLGGINDPYDVAVIYGSPIASIQKDTDLFGVEHAKIVWNSSDCFEQINLLMKNIKEADPDNIYCTTSIFCWDYYVSKAVSQGITDPDAIISYVTDSVSSNWMTSIALGWALNEYESLPSSVIVLMCGPYIDYTVNKSLGAIGYHMNSERQVVLDHVMVQVFTKRTATSVSSMDTAVKVDGATSKFVSDNSNLTGYKSIGTSSICKHIAGYIDSTLFILIALMCLVIFLVMALVERRLIFTAVGFILSFMGMAISAAVIDAIADVFHFGSMSIFIPMFIPILCLMISEWYALIQYSAGKHTDSLHGMNSFADPIITVTSVILVVFALLMMFTDIDFVRQTALAVCIVALIEGFCIRALLSPGLWVMLNVSFRKKKTEPESSE